MKRVFIPYYLSRALIAAGLGWFAHFSGLSTWASAAMGVVVFSGFIAYLHSGWFLVDPSNPLFPLRRDERSANVRNRALITAVAVGGILYAAGSILGQGSNQAVNGSLAFAAAVGVYFIVSWWLFSR